ncbi:MAG: hypothetical protein ACWGMZ_06725, partial [Thermoguttaceae bacterium]
RLNGNELPNAPRYSARLGKMFSGSLIPTGQLIGCFESLKTIFFIGYFIGDAKNPLAINS